MNKVIIVKEKNIANVRKTIQMKMLSSLEGRMHQIGLFFVNDN